MWKMWVRFLQDTLPQQCGKAIAFGFSFIIKYPSHTATGYWSIRLGSIPSAGIIFEKG